MADIDREPERRGIDPAVGEAGEELTVAINSIDQHAWFGFESERDATLMGLFENGWKALQQAIERFILPCSIVNDSRPE
jgi:hypothetical protein